MGRGSKWGNPFVMKSEEDRPNVITQYNVWLKQQIRVSNYTLEELAALHNKDLVCFCAPKACHADSLLKVAAWANNLLNTTKGSMC